MLNAVLRRGALLALWLVGSIWAQSPPEIGRQLILRSQQAAIKGDAGRATRLLYEGLTYPLDQTLLDSLFVDVADIATERDREAYEESEPKTLFFRRFWHSLDPTPATPENERYVEHYQRLDYARKQFASSLPRGYDDRGMIYVRYGPPDDRFISPAGGFTRAMESWVYQRLGNINFDFVEYGASYQLESNFLRALIAVPADERDRARMIRDMFAARAELGLVYSRVQEQLDRELEMVEQGIKPFERELVARLVNDFVSDVDRQHEELPPSSTDVDLEEYPLGFWLSYGRFRLDERRSRVELYFGVPLRNLVFEPDSSGRLHTALENYFRLVDSNSDVVVQDRRVYPIWADNRAEIDTVDYVGQLTLFLPPDTFRVGFELRNPAGNKRQFYTLRLIVPAVEPRRLALSDVQFAQVIRSASSDSLRNRGFIKGDLYVEPYPYAYIPRGKAMEVYFEIYNLSVDGKGRTRYRVEYEIIGERSGSGLLSVLGAINPFKKGEKTSSSTAYDRQGETARTVEHVRFNFDELRIGLYTFRVKVIDRKSGQVAETSRRFRLIE
jgi:GWxTD domain-containing protein